MQQENNCNKGSSSASQNAEVKSANKQNETSQIWFYMAYGYITVWRDETMILEECSE